MARTKPTAAPPESLGPLVRRLREKRGLRLVDLARASGIDAGNLSKLEHGAGPRTPRLSTLKRLAAALGVRPGRLADAA